jgi:hypothetical protein
MYLWTFGENTCHPERGEGPGSPDAEILRCAQDDSQGAQDDSKECYAGGV